MYTMDLAVVEICTRIACEVDERPDEDVYDICSDTIDRFAEEIDYRKLLQIELSEPGILTKVFNEAAFTPWNGIDISVIETAMRINFCYYLFDNVDYRQFGTSMEDV